MFTLVHIKGGGALGAALLEQVSDAATKIVEGDEESIAAELNDARDRGAVICVVPKDRHVAMLAAGADEAVSPDIGKDELADVLARAGARARTCSRPTTLARECLAIEKKVG